MRSSLPFMEERHPFEDPHQKQNEAIPSLKNANPLLARFMMREIGKDTSSFAQDTNNFGLADTIQNNQDTTLESSLEESEKIWNTEMKKLTNNFSEKLTQINFFVLTKMEQDSFVEFVSQAINFLNEFQQSREIIMPHKSVYNRTHIREKQNWLLQSMSTKRIIKSIKVLQGVLEFEKENQIEGYKNLAKENEVWEKIKHKIQSYEDFLVVFALFTDFENENKNFYDYYSESYERI